MRSLSNLVGEQAQDIKSGGKDTLNNNENIFIRSDGFKGPSYVEADLEEEKT